MNQGLDQDGIHPGFQVGPGIDYFNINADAC
jgi:hypothetical protein